MAKKLLPSPAQPTSPKKKLSVTETSYWSGLNDMLAVEESEPTPPEVHGIRRASIRKRIL